MDKTQLVLERVSKVNDVPTVYKDSTGRTFEFKAGKVAWTYSVLKNDFDKKLARKIIEAYEVAGLSQHDHPGGFEGATSKIAV